MLIRPRRNRRTDTIRRMVQETRLEVSQLVYPLFLVDGNQIKNEVASLPGNYRLSQDEALKMVESCLKSGLSNFILFPSVAEKYKDKKATYSWSEDNFYLKIVAKMKEEFPDTTLISDVAMDGGVRTHRLRRLISAAAMQPTGRYRRRAAMRYAKLKNTRTCAQMRLNASAVKDAHGTE